MTWRGNPHFKTPEPEPHYAMHFSVILRTLLLEWGGGLASLQRGGGTVSLSPSNRLETPEEDQNAVMIMTKMTTPARVYLYISGTQTIILQFIFLRKSNIKSLRSSSLNYKSISDIKLFLNSHSNVTCRTSVGGGSWKSKYTNSLV